MNILWHKKHLFITSVLKYLLFPTNMHKLTHYAADMLWTLQTDFLWAGFSNQPSNIGLQVFSKFALRLIISDWSLKLPYMYILVIDSSNLEIFENKIMENLDKNCHCLDAGEENIVGKGESAQFHLSPQFFKSCMLWKRQNSANIQLTLSLIRQFCSRRLWTYFVKK